MAGRYVRVLVGAFVELVERSRAQYRNAAVRAVPIGVRGRASNFQTVRTGFASGRCGGVLHQVSMRSSQTNTPEPFAIRFFETHHRPRKSIVR